MPRDFQPPVTYLCTGFLKLREAKLPTGGDCFSNILQARTLSSYVQMILSKLVCALVPAESPKWLHQMAILRIAPSGNISNIHSNSAVSEMGFFFSNVGSVCATSAFYSANLDPLSGKLVNTVIVESNL